MKNSKIFLANDIRGIFPDEINEGFAEKLGWTLADYLGFQGSVVVSGDARESTPKLKEALCKGLNEMGVNTVDIGMGPTPMLYFTLANSKSFDLGIAITASHNPPEFNGFKVCNEDGVSLSYENFFNAIETKIQLTKKDFKRKKMEAGNQSKGTHKIDIELQDAYFSFLKETAKSISPLNLVVEYGNGCTGRFREVLPFEAKHLHEEPKGNFPILNPDPTKEKSYEFVKKFIESNDAELAIVFDGDGDRVGFMGPDGNIISPDLVMMMFFDDILKVKSPSVVLDVKISKATSEYIEKKGGICRLSKVGHSYIQELVLEENFDLAGELSCHYYFNDDYFGFDDGLYSAIRFLKIFSEMKSSGLDFDAIRNQYPTYHSSPEIRLKIERARHEGIFDELREFAIANGADLLEIDGIRAEFKDGWFLVRSSNTESKLSYRIEAQTKERLNSLKRSVEQIIERHRD